MRHIHSNILEFRGSHYDFGFRQGELLKDSITLDNRTKQWKAKRPRFEIDLEDTEQAYRKFAPGIWEELIGLQESLELPMEEVVRDFGGYRIDAMPSGCSILTGQDFMVRNYDFHPQTYEGRFSLFQPDDQGYAIIGPTSRITGRMDGMNEKGLAMGYNFTHRKKPGDGFVCYLIGRIILETCATIEEAVALLKEIPHRGSFSYIVTDPSGETRIIEASPRAVDVRVSNVCTNHFEIQQHENRNYLKDSFGRLEAIHTQKSQTEDALQAFRLFNDTDKGVFSELYKSWAGTIHTSLYLPKEKSVWFALGGNQQPTVFDFDSWLKGKELDIQKVHGAIDTEIGFAHLDKQFLPKQEKGASI
ncbi:C45 family autoproteolytic acyltransferase/hydolase [uncultured Planococcus sp.]|uniref:C45 family autoproteolytic acyltransferase/hydolase n=1 Tax=uncultured Planococcus sp. TaxID=337815 RepID=UPI00261E5481|nr:C45 family autoproteolytic acyltransferase/hydolase [uncultured Planococcus sp.]